MKLKPLARIGLGVRKVISTLPCTGGGRRTGDAPLLEENLLNLYGSVFSYIKDKDEGQQNEFTMLLDHVRNQIVLNHWSSKQAWGGNADNEDGNLLIPISISLLLICQLLPSRVVNILHIVWKHIMDDILQETNY